MENKQMTEGKIRETERASPKAAAVPLPDAEHIQPLEE